MEEREADLPRRGIRVLSVMLEIFYILIEVMIINIHIEMIEREKDRIKIYHIIHLKFVHFYVCIFDLSFFFFFKLSRRQNNQGLMASYM